MTLDSSSVRNERILGVYGCSRHAKILGVRSWVYCSTFYISIIEFVIRNWIILADGSFIEIEVFVSSPNHCLIPFIEVLLGDDVAVLSDSLHASLLADASNISCTDLIRSANILL